MRLGLLLAVVALYLSLPVSAEPKPDDPTPAARLYQHLKIGHRVQGTMPYHALTSHGTEHAVRSNSPFFFVVEGPADIRDFMYGAIFNSHDRNKAPEYVKPIYIVQPRLIKIPTSTPSIRAGFQYFDDLNGQISLIIDDSNLLKLPDGLYTAVFFLVNVSPEAAENAPSARECFVWEFTISENGEQLNQINIHRPVNTKSLNTIGIGKPI